ncbi:LacI family transcriptional regulator [Mucilaginibacter daejeonensis]|uniref:LacI family DNA-binding transcriptional regulator n=1 Tax=Mucilaginibacter daejeonensis TaxID=398049 RepID=UPI001D173BBC|nr:LacI family DNA-binding transcriptional regulator [Mucilaginibacter daejeonensis]UEG52485.1 LacI family transcriptional regulator [Mucilaginibacter daejeonensis]
METITIKLLAERLKLSTATISKALGDSHEISDMTKKRVFELAKELNYVPNAYASSLRRNKSKTIAVLIPEVADSFFSIALNGIEEVALQKGYHTLIYLTHEKLEREKAILKELLYGRVDGALMSVSSETDSYEHIVEFGKKLPVVFFDRVCHEPRTAKMTTNDLECGYLATQHLIEAGCKRIVMLSISKSLSIISDRSEGFHNAIADHGLDPALCEVINCGEEEEATRSALMELLQRDQRPDGIIATVERLTTDIYLACKDLGISIPHDLKVICFSNQASAVILNPSLTTITQPAFELGKAAATALLKRLKNPGLDLAEESQVIPSVLNARGSTATE